MEQFALQGKLACPQVLEKISSVGGGCSDCDVVPISGGEPLPCREWSDIDSGQLKEIVFTDEVLFNSGFIRKINRSALGERMQVKTNGITIGQIKTEDTGHRRENECDVCWESVGTWSFKKTFYTVNTGKALKMCTKELIGTTWQDYVGNKQADFDPENFADTDLADILIALIIDTYRKEFIASFVLLSVRGGSSKNRHGDNGVFMKAYAARNEEFFHAVSVDFSDVDLETQCLTVQLNGAEETFTPSAFDDLDDLILNDEGLLAWITKHSTDGQQQVHATWDDVNQNLILSSGIAKCEVEAHIAAHDCDTAHDWCCIKHRRNLLPCTKLQNRMVINDVPLIFDYCNLTPKNALEMFDSYLNAFLEIAICEGRMVNVSEIRIGVDPLIQFYIARQLRGLQKNNDNNAAMEVQTGLSASNFIAIPALLKTGLFFMTVTDNILLFTDNDVDSNGLPTSSRVRIIKHPEGCLDHVGILFEMLLGTAIDKMAYFAANLCGSPWAEENDVDNVELLDNEKATIARWACHDNGDCVNSCESKCDISLALAISESYNAEEDQTTFTVSASGAYAPEGCTLEYALNVSGSDALNEGGTSIQAVNEEAFSFTVPGDVSQDIDGVAISYWGSVKALDEKGNVKCVADAAFQTESYGANC